jgi:hypothetical protein
MYCNEDILTYSHGQRDAERLPELRENDNDSTIGKNALGENIAHEKQELK